MLPKRRMASATVREIEHLSDFGLGPAAALKAATIAPATWLGADAEVGSIEVGKRADFIAMDENPLTDSAALRGIRWVMIDGDLVRDDRNAVLDV